MLVVFQTVPREPPTPRASCWLLSPAKTADVCYFQCFTSYTCCHQLSLCYGFRYLQVSKLRNRPLLISATYFTLKRMLLITFQLWSYKCPYLMPLFQESKQCLYDITSYILLRYYFKRTVIDWKTVTTKEILMIWVW